MINLNWDDLKGKLLKLKYKGIGTISNDDKVHQVLMALPKTFLLESIIRLSILHYNYEHIVDFSERVNNSDYFYDNLIGNSDGLLNEIPEDIKPIFDIIATVYCGWIDKMKNIGADLFEVFPELKKYDLIKFNNEVFKLSNFEIDALLKDEQISTLIHNFSAIIDDYLAKSGKYPNSCFYAYDTEIADLDFENGTNLTEKLGDMTNILGSLTGGSTETESEDIIIPKNLSASYVFNELAKTFGIEGDPKYSTGFFQTMSFEDYCNNILPTLTMISDVILDYVINGNLLGLFDESDYYVNLGLPSGTKWCCRNVGTASPTQTGKYFSWGDTTGVHGSLFDMSNVTLGFMGSQQMPMEQKIEAVLFANGLEATEENIAMATEAIENGTVDGVVGKPNYFTENNYTTTVNVENASPVDGTDFYVVVSDTNVGNELFTRNDAASVNESANWKMPTKEQLEELINNTEISGVFDESTGYPLITFTGRTGETMHIYPSGLCTNSTIVSFEQRGGSVLGLWSSTINNEKPNEAYALLIYYNKDSNTFTPRVESVPVYYGMAIRPVYVAHQDVKELTDKACSVYNFYNILDKFIQDGVVTCATYEEPHVDIITGKYYYNEDGSYKMRKRYDIIDSKIKAVLFSPLFQIYITEDNTAYFGGCCYVPSLIGMLLETIVNKLHLLIPETAGIPPLKEILPMILEIIWMFLLSFLVRIGEGFWDGSILKDDYIPSLLRPILELLEDLTPDEDENPEEDDDIETPDVEEEIDNIDETVSLPEPAVNIDGQEIFDSAITSFNGVLINSSTTETGWVHYANFNNRVHPHGHGCSDNWFIQFVNGGNEYMLNGNTYNDKYFVLIKEFLTAKYNHKTLYVLDNTTGEYKPFKFVPRISYFNMFEPGSGGDSNTGFAPRKLIVNAGEYHNMDHVEVCEFDELGNLISNAANYIHLTYSYEELYSILLNGNYTQWYTYNPAESGVLPTQNRVADYINLPLDNGSIKTAGGGFAIEVDSNTIWNVTCDVNWVTVKDINGCGSRRIALHVDDYTVEKTTRNRTANITFTSTIDSSVSKTFVLTQLCFEEILIVSSSKKDDITYNGKQFTIKVVSNTNWHVQCLDAADLNGNAIDWITVNNYEGEKNGSIVVNVLKNSIRENRTGYVVINTEDIVKCIEFNQLAHVDELSVKQTHYELPSTKYELYVPIKSNTYWNVTTSADWLTTDITSGYMDNSIVIYVNENTTNDVRVGCVNIITQDITISIEIEQVDITDYFEVRPQILSVNSRFGYANINISTNLNWNIEYNSDWFVLNKTQGTNSANVIAIVSENLTNNDRSSEIRVFNDTYEFIVTLVQYATGNIELTERQRLIEQIKETNGVWILDNNNYIHYCNMNNVNYDHGDTDDYFVQLGGVYLSNDTSKSYLDSIDCEYILNGQTYNDNFLELSKAMLTANYNSSYVCAFDANGVLSEFKFAPETSPKSMDLASYLGDILSYYIGGDSYSYADSYSDSYEETRYSLSDLKYILTNNTYTEYRTVEYNDSLNVTTQN